MSLRAIWIVFRKEILDIIRDRRTLIFMIILPLLLMPLLFSLIKNFSVSNELNISSTDSRVAIIGVEDAPELVAFLQNQRRNKFEATGNETVDAFMIENQSGVNAFLAIRTDITTVEEAQDLIRKEELDAALVIPEDFELMLQPRTIEVDTDTTAAVEFRNDISIRIDYLSTDDYSDRAIDRLAKSLNTYRDEVVARRLENAGYSMDMIKPFDRSSGDLATKQEIGGKILGRMLPYMIILMTFVGAIFPAISLGAGEKEQKTLESLLVSPVGRADMITGKFLTIVTTGIVSAVLAMIGMYYGFTQFGEVQQVQDLFTLQMDPLSMVMAALLMLPLAFVFAGILLSVSVFAKSYREAQSYMGVLQFAIIIPAFVSFLPGVELNYTLAWAPVINVSLVLQNILSGKAMEILPYFGITILSTLILAGLSIWFCSLIFKKESAIFKV